MSVGGGVVVCALSVRFGCPFWWYVVGTFVSYALTVRFDCMLSVRFSGTFRWYVVGAFWWCVDGMLSVRLGGMLARW